MARHKNTPTYRRGGRIRGGPSDEEIRAVANLRKTWADADAAKAAQQQFEPEPVEKRVPSSHTLYIARKVGVLSSDLAWRHGLFVETVRDILPASYHKGIIGATALHSILMNGVDIGKGARHLLLPREEGVTRLMESLPDSATQDTTGKVRDVEVRYFKGGLRNPDLANVRDVCLGMTSHTIKSEMLCLANISGNDQPSPRILIPLVEGEPGVGITRDQRNAVMSAAKEVFMGQIFPFEPAEPITHIL
jgi:hypothetical protein